MASPLARATSVPCVSIRLAYVHTADDTTHGGTHVRLWHGFRAVQDPGSGMEAYLNNSMLRIAYNISVLEASIWHAPTSQRRRCSWVHAGRYGRGCGRPLSESSDP